MTREEKALQPERNIHNWVVRQLGNRMPRGATCILVGALLTAGAWSAAADCAQWDLSGTWSIRQSNKITVTFEIQQLPTRIAGSASYPRMEGELQQMKIERGGVRGKLFGHEFNLEVKWNYGETGVYVGTIASDGTISGHAFIKEDPNNGARTCNWHSKTRMHCADASKPSASSSDH